MRLKTIYNMHALHCTLHTANGIQRKSKMEKTAIALGFYLWNRSEKGGCRIAIQLFNQIRLREKCFIKFSELSTKTFVILSLTVDCPFHRKNNNFIQQQCQNKSNKFTIRIESIQTTIMKIVQSHQS